MKHTCTAIVLCIVAQIARADDVALIGATVYPDPESPAIHDAAVIVHDGVIAAVGSRTGMEIPTGARVVDCSGAFITAGFWNSHIHILTPALLQAATVSAADLNGELDEMLNRWGFTTAFDIASVLESTLALRRRIDAHEVRGPRILTVGEPIWSEVPGYVRDYFNANHIEMPPVRTPQDAVRRVQILASRGANGVKLFTGSLQGGYVTHLSLDIARLAAKEAHRHHLPVFTHAQDMEGVDVSIGAGVDVIAHLTPGTPNWTSALASKLVRARIAIVPTLTLFDFESRRDGDTDEARETLLAKLEAELRAFTSAGGEVLFGTDVGYMNHFDTELEFRLMAKSGFDFRQILATLTTNPARRFESSRQSGRVERSFAGDLVVLDGDPARDVGNLSRVRYTIRAGEIIYATR